MPPGDGLNMSQNWQIRTIYYHLRYLRLKFWKINKICREVECIEPGIFDKAGLSYTPFFAPLETLTWVTPSNYRWLRRNMVSVDDLLSLRRYEGNASAKSKMHNNSITTQEFVITLFLVYTNMRERRRYTTAKLINYYMAIDERDE